jgi:signal transduction protein with GAF and PtsI domain
VFIAAEPGAPGSSAARTAAEAAAYAAAQRDQARLAELHFALDRIADSVLELPARLNAVTQVIRLRLGCDVCSIYVLEPEEQTLLLQASFGLAPESVGQAQLKVGEGVTGWVGEHMEAVALADAPADPRFKYLPETHEERYRSLLSVPIVADRAFVGVINVQHRLPHEFGASEQLLVEGIGYKVGAMIRAARLEAELLEREAGLELMLWAAGASFARRGTKLAPEMLDRCRRALGAKAAVLRLKDRMDGQLKVAATTGLGHLGETLPALAPGEGIAGLTLAQEAPFRCNHYADFAGLLVSVQAVSSSILCVPVIHGRKAVGTLSLLDRWGTTGPGRFGREDEAVLSGVARLMARGLAA